MNKIAPKTQTGKLKRTLTKTSDIEDKGTNLNVPLKNTYFNLDGENANLVVRSGPPLR